MTLSVKDFAYSMDMFRPISIFRSRQLVWLIIFPLLLGWIFLPARHCPAATIVLDPGHGGSDSGAGRDSEFSEKQFTLALAQKIAGLLAPHHRVELTRAADIQMPPSDRAAVANHLQADLMISLHAAVAPYCNRRSATIYYYNDERLAFPSGLSVQGSLTESDTELPAWTMLQVRHHHQSQLLADTIKRSLGATDIFEHVTVSGAPLVALMGADLPAILMEVGCLHPKMALNPQVQNQQLNAIADAIAKAIEAALPDLKP